MFDRWPPTMMVPVRSFPEFGAIVKRTEPLPLPVNGSLSEIHVTVAVAVQGQSLGAVTATLPAPPAVPML